jgi:SAM-dependent methyltransferase
MSSDLSKTAELWGSTDGALWRTSKWIHWLQHPKVQERCNRLVSGDPGLDRFQYFIARYFPGRSTSPRVKRVLTLGCGHGEFERGLSTLKFAQAHDAMDLAPAAIDDARRLAEAEGLRHVQYSVGDLNTVELPRCTYDVVFGVSSIHHVSNLEHLFHQVVLSLKPGGYFFLDEYVGPNKMQWTDEQLGIINEQIAALPSDLKRSVFDDSLKGAIWRNAVEDIDAVDPSEAVRSADILRILPLYFDIIEVKGSGGSLLHMLLEGIAGNFLPDNPRAMSYLESLFRLEDDLIACGRLQHDFAVIIARRKPTRVEKLLGPKAAYVVTKTRALCSRGH